MRNVIYNGGNSLRQISASSLQNVILVFTIFISLLFAQDYPYDYDSGGELIREQAAYDVTHYDLNLTIEPENHFIFGSLTVTATALDTLSWLVMDLVTVMTIDSIKINGFNQDFQRQSSRLWIKLPELVNISDTIKATIHYYGHPLTESGTQPGGVHPCKGGGFNWFGEYGFDLIGIKCEQVGADVWWPCKEHPSDEPDSMALHFTVPKPYFCASNGKLVSIDDNNDGTQTFNWNVSTPINNYNVTLNIGKYEVLYQQYRSVAGDNIDIFFWVLPEEKSVAETLFPEIIRQLGFFEQYFGPYPFRADKLGYVQSKYNGMEHQTIISIGIYDNIGKYQNTTLNKYGFDYILFHETAHEWWGNLITAKDWKDAWIHEGFATYTEAMYHEYIYGINSYHNYVSRWSYDNYIPIATHESRTAFDSFGCIGYPWTHMYSKGALVLHSLRYLLGDATFYSLLRQFLYPDANLENDTSGTACRLVTTEEFITLAEQLSGQELDWFFNLYIYTTENPVLLYYLKDGKLLLKWKVDSVPDFNMPVVVKFNNQEYKIEMNDGLGEIEVGSYSYGIDPYNWILKGGLQEDSSLETTTTQVAIVSFKLYNNYPNPFNPATTITFDLSEEVNVKISIYDMTGRLIRELVNQPMTVGSKTINWDGNDESGNPVSGSVYFYNLQAGNYNQTKKMSLIK